MTGRRRAGQSIVGDERGTESRRWGLGEGAAVAVGLPAAIVALLWAVHRIEPGAGALRLARAEWAASDADAPPPEARWRPTTLPHDWIHDPPPAASAWYRLRAHLDVEPEGVWALYLPTVSQNAALWVGGRLVGDGGRLEDPAARHWNRPLYLRLPAGTLRRGENELLLRVVARPTDWGILGPVFLGPDTVLAPTAGLRRFLKDDLLGIITTAALVMALFMGLLGALRPGDSTYLWYAVISLCWCLHALTLLVVEIPVATRYWDWLAYLAMGWQTLLTMGFTHRFLGYHRPRTERVVFSWGAAIHAALLALALADSAAFYPVANFVWGPSLLVVGTYSTWMWIHAFVVRRSTGVLLLLMTGVLMMLTSAHDNLVVRGAIGRLDGFFLPYDTPVVIVAFCYLLLRRFVGALDEAEALNVELEDRVRAKARELEASYARMRELERATLLARERQRIMRDMHDGVGGQLVAALAMAERDRDDGPVADAVRQALADLRLMIDSLDPLDDDLNEVLAQLRARVQAPLDARGVALHWQVADLAHVARLGPEKTLHILRILQEAMTNALKHARATRVRVVTAAAGTVGGRSCRAVIEVHDDGTGFAPAAAGGGRGLESMRARAAGAGLVVDVESAPGRGTVVRLGFPESA